MHRIGWPRLRARFPVRIVSRRAPATVGGHGGGTAYPDAIFATFFY
jgi:hypothetical protein